VAKNSCDLKAARAFDIHEKTIWGLNQTLELVLALFVSLGWVEKIFWHFCCCLFFFLKYFLYNYYYQLIIYFKIIIIFL